MGIRFKFESFMEVRLCQARPVRVGCFAKYKFNAERLGQFQACPTGCVCQTINSCKLYRLSNKASCHMHTNDHADPYCQTLCSVNELLGESYRNINMTANKKSQSQHLWFVSQLWHDVVTGVKKSQIRLQILPKLSTEIQYSYSLVRVTTMLY